MHLTSIIKVKRSEVGAAMFTGVHSNLSSSEMFIPISPMIL